MASDDLLDELQILMDADSFAFFKSTIYLFIIYKSKKYSKEWIWERVLNNLKRLRPHLRYHLRYQATKIMLQLPKKIQGKMAMDKHVDYLKSVLSQYKKCQLKATKTDETSNNKQSNNKAKNSTNNSSNYVSSDESKTDTTNVTNMTDTSHFTNDAKIFESSENIVESVDDVDDDDDNDGFFVPREDTLESIANVNMGSTEFVNSHSLHTLIDSELKEQADLAANDTNDAKLSMDVVIHINEKYAEFASLIGYFPRSRDLGNIGDIIDIPNV